MSELKRSTDWVGESPRLPKRKKQRCRICGCTQDNACEGGCYWVEEDLCSQCMENPEEASA